MRGTANSLVFQPNGSATWFPYLVLFDWLSDDFMCVVLVFRFVISD